MSHHLHNLAFLSTHTSPLAVPGTTKAGGMNVYIAELTRCLGRMGRRVDVFTRRDRLGLPETIDLAPNVRVVHIAAGPAAPLAPLDVHPHVPAFTDGVRAFAERHDAAYDLVHAHYWLSGLSGLALANAWHVPHVAMFHTLGAVKNRARRAEREPAQRIDAERAVVQGADRLVCATPHERDFLAQLYGADPAAVSVVPGGVDLDRFKPGSARAARRRLGLPNAPLALVVGRLEPLKGIDIAIRAVALVDLDRPLTLAVLGGAPDEDAARDPLQRLAAALGIAERVRFIPAVDRSTLADYYRAADVCLVPSYYESFGLVAVEALASGLPVIATRVGGLQYTVRDAQTGYLIPWRCPEPFAERLEALLANPDLQRRFRGAARASVRPFAWDAVAARVIDVYEEVLAAHAAGESVGRAG